MTGPNFYTIDFDREIVLQGQSSTFVTISRNDFNGNVAGTNPVYIMLFPNSRTFNSFYSGNILPGDPSLQDPTTFKNVSLSNSDSMSVLQNPGTMSFNNVAAGMIIKNSYDFVTSSTGITGIGLGVTATSTSAFGQSNATLFSYDATVGLSKADGTFSINSSTGGNTAIHIGYWDNEAKNHWKINGKSLADLETIAYTSTIIESDIVYRADVKNIFDGSILSISDNILNGTGYSSRNSLGWASLNYDDNMPNNSITFRIDYDGELDSHLKCNFLIWTGSTTNDYLAPSVTPTGLTGVNMPFGIKSGELGYYSPNVDYQELHVFGYTQTKVRTSKETWQNNLTNTNHIYDDLSSYGLLKTNPVISGNVKLTVDSSENIWLNSFDANDELSNSSYKRFPITPSSTFPIDLYRFFKNGKTPSSTVYDLYQVDSSYDNTKRNLYEQYDNFYNYGVENQKNRSYDETFSFLAPIWLRKNLPDYFVIFKVDHPLSTLSYKQNVTNTELFSEFFNDSQIIKTFDLRESSLIGKYLRNIINDPRWKDKPLDVSFDEDIATTWYGISYADGTMTGKGEFLYNYFSNDTPITEFEEYITKGFARNGLISTNLINLEFLFNDTTSSDYAINRYFGLYVTENQLASFKIASNVIGKIENQLPIPQNEVDGQVYSNKSFVQTNPSGVEIPISYYHNSSNEVNKTNIPAFQGDVIGKLPLPSLVEDPLRIFYIKDRNDDFKRIKSISEIDYGNAGTSDYSRVSQVKLYETSEDICNYTGVNQITSQITGTCLEPGNSQLRLHLSSTAGEKVFADQEVIELNVKQFNSDSRKHSYYFKYANYENVGSNSISFIGFKDQYVEQLKYTSLLNGAYIPSVGETFKNFKGNGTYLNVSNGSLGPIGAPCGLPVKDPTKFSIGEQIYITNIGYFIITEIDYDLSTIDFINPGTLGNISYVESWSNLQFNELITTGVPTFNITYNYSATSNSLNVDTLLTLLFNETEIPSFSGNTAFLINTDKISVSINNLSTTNESINAFVTDEFNQFTWRMIANSVGLKPGTSWKYPMPDNNETDYVTQFSNAGTPSQVASALASAINSFSNCPCNATPYNDTIYLKSLISGDAGNNLEISRNLVQGESRVYNLGFYEYKNVNVSSDISVLNLIGSSSYTYPITVKMLDTYDIFGSTYDYVKLFRTSNGCFAEIRIDVDSTSINTARNSGSNVYSVVNTSGNELFTYIQIPYSIDISNVPLNTYTEYVLLKSIGPDVISQTFVGGNSTSKNRASISIKDAQRYYENRIAQITGNLTQDSNILSNVNDLTHLYIGALVTGTGIPANTIIDDISIINNLVYVSNKINITQKDAIISIGKLSILNTSIIDNQWFQTQKGEYSAIYGWNVQGKLIYSLPYLEETNNKNLDTYNIIQISNSNQSFYQTLNKQLVAYDIFKPSIGIFSFFPIKEFDFDFKYSEYSYTPIVEAFRYYFNQQVSIGNPVILPVDENWDILCSEAGTFSIKIEGLNPNTSNWDYLTDIIAGYNVPEIILNTYYPFYVYDVTENPLTPEDLNRYKNSANISYNISGSGLRNFMSQRLSSNDGNGNVTEVIPTSYRITFDAISVPSDATFTITKNDYSQDIDIKKFQGFASLQDIQTSDDVNNYRDLIAQGNNIDAFLSQSLKSEYDRLRENYNKAYAVNSKVVPYINKWVQVGTDARDNYYRLNLSNAFGVSNLSPETTVNFSESSILTNEFTYLDTVPKDYPVESLEGSRSYMFTKLSDIAFNNSSWYDLLTSDISNDWFTKYFSVGYPSENDQFGKKVTKSREERFTFFEYSNGLKRAQTLFRGSKIQVLDLINGAENVGSTKFDNYKFSAITQFVPYKPYSNESPVTFEICKNDTSQSIVMIITVRLQDYRIQSGLNDYLFLYAMNDQLKNYGQQQVAVPVPTDLVNIGIQSFLNNNSFSPYSYYSTKSYTDLSTMRPRQGFGGGGYLELGDTLLGGSIIEQSKTLSSPEQPLSIDNLFTFTFKSKDNFNFSVLNEISPTLDNYTLKNNTFATEENLIVKDGLVLNLDAGNNASFSGSGQSVWYDLSGHGNDMYLANCGYSPDNHGSLTENGTNSYSFVYNDITNLGLNLTGTYTIDLWLKYNVEVGLGINTLSLCSTDNNALQIGESDGLGVIWRLGGTHLISFNQPPAGEIFNLTVVVNGNIISVYINGLFVGTNTTDSLLPGNISHVITSGFYANNKIVNANYFNGNLYTIKLYDRDLSHKEIWQNFNSLATRYTNTLSSVLPIYPTSLTKNGSIYKFLDVTSTEGTLQIINRQNSKISIDQFLPEQISFSSTNHPNSTAFIYNKGSYNLGIEQYLINSESVNSADTTLTIETFNIKGGTNAYKHIKNLLTYSSITDNINNKTSLIQYFNVTDKGKTIANDFQLNIIAADQIVKNNVLIYVDDTDIPKEYLGKTSIGYNIVNSNQNEVVYRHRGSYEPKSRDVLTFWVRESKDFSEHFAQDYLLLNTHFNEVSAFSGTIRNYNISKVADDEVLKIAKKSAYHSVYPLIGEVSIDTKDAFIFESTWDSAFYQKYIDTINWKSVDGINEMHEFKFFLGSKAMNIPSKQQLETFNTSELTYSITPPSKSVGVSLFSRLANDFSGLSANSNNILTINIDAVSSLLRKMIEDMTKSVDEFSWLQTLNIPQFYNLDDTVIYNLKKAYLLYNIVKLYKVEQVNLYSIQEDGLPIVDTNLTLAQKNGNGYKIDKNCNVSVNSSTLSTTIVKELNSHVFFSYSVEIILARI